MQFCYSQNLLQFVFMLHILSPATPACLSLYSIRLTSPSSLKGFLLLFRDSCSIDAGVPACTKDRMKRSAILLIYTVYYYWFF